MQFSTSSLNLTNPQWQKRSKGKYYVFNISTISLFLVEDAMMKQQNREEKQTKRRQTMDRFSSVSGLLLSVVCCIALIHVELRIQEHHRQIYHSVTFCDKLEREILRKAEENYGKWQVILSSRHRQTTNGRCRYMLLMFPIEVALYSCTVILYLKIICH